MAPPWVHTWSCMKNSTSVGIRTDLLTFHKAFKPVQEVFSLPTRDASVFFFVLVFFVSIDHAGCTDLILYISWHWSETSESHRISFLWFSDPLTTVYIFLFGFVLVCLCKAIIFTLSLSVALLTQTRTSFKPSCYSMKNWHTPPAITLNVIMLYYTVKPHIHLSDFITFPYIYNHTKRKHMKRHEYVVQRVRKDLIFSCILQCNDNYNYNTPFSDFSPLCILNTATECTRVSKIQSVQITIMKFVFRISPTAAGTIKRKRWSRPYPRLQRGLQDGTCLHPIHYSPLC